MKSKALTIVKREIKAAQVRIGKERDKLRDLLGDMEQLEQDTADAEERLQEAIDKLSELQ
jgi:predicted  nucleic acid-binding Zn-ribbon protein